jgi:hypothetical protein
VVTLDDKVWLWLVGRITCNMAYDDDDDDNDDDDNNNNNNNNNN